MAGFFGAEAGDTEFTREAPSRKTSPRLLEPERYQCELRPLCIDELVDADHKVRAVWQLVERMDLSRFTAKIRSREGGAGRPGIDPRMLLSLWIWATIRGVGSARYLESLCSESAPFRWICGGVNVNHHTLSDFRNNCEELDELLTQCVTALLKARLVKMERVAQDGVKLHACAGKHSLKKKEQLNLCAQAKQQVEILKNELHDAPQASRARIEAARRRAKEQLNGRLN